MRRAWGERPESDATAPEQIQSALAGLGAAPWSAAADAARQWPGLGPGRGGAELPATHRRPDHRAPGLIGVPPAARPGRRPVRAPRALTGLLPSAAVPGNRHAHRSQPPWQRQRRGSSWPGVRWRRHALRHRRHVGRDRRRMVLRHRSAGDPRPDAGVSTEQVARRRPSPRCNPAHRPTQAAASWPPCSVTPGGHWGDLSAPAASSAPPPKLVLFSNAVQLRQDRFRRGPVHCHRPKVYHRPRPISGARGTRFEGAGRLRETCIAARSQPPRADRYGTSEKVRAAQSLSPARPICRLQVLMEPQADLPISIWANHARTARARSSSSDIEALGAAAAVGSVTIRNACKVASNRSRSPTAPRSGA